MTRRLLLSYLTVAVVVLVLLEVPLGMFYAQRERERVTAGLEHDASVLASIYEDALEAGSTLDPAPAEEYERRTGARVVVTDAAGVSRVDTGGAVPRDFSTRPEITQALSGSRATGTRRSETLDTDLQYVALAVASGGQVHGSVRLTLDVADVNRRIQRLWLALAGMAVVVLAVVALVGWVIARSVTSPLRRLNAAATRFADGDLRTEELPATGPPELRELAATMTAMAARLDALLTSQRSFVADASHQLRTPLTALRLRLENVESGLDEPAAGEVAAAIEETRRLADLVNQLLLLARVDERPVLEPTDVGSLARDRVDTWGAVAQGSDVTLHLDAPDHVRPALAVRGAVEQVLDNLIDNALAVSSPDTTITIAVRDTADAVELTVSDQGPGLPDDQKADALRRFWRGDTSTPGTGLGLAIVDRLIAASGGSLRLTDAPGGGLRVVVRLPAARFRPGGS
jgi:signal transduction histidine kinase